MMWSQFIENETKNKYEQDELLNELYKQMFIVAYSKVRNKSDALDVVQESWVKILNKIDTLKDKDKLIQWAKVIASNTAINLIRKRSTMQEVLVCNEQFELNNQMDENEIDEQLLVAELYNILKVLDKDTREIFIYKYNYGWKDQQIADKLELPLGTVKAKLSRGRARLRAALLKGIITD